MIVTKCPVRISLVGGSSDLDSFLDKNEMGSVISFPCNLNTYISVHENHRNKFIIDYSSQEEVDEISDIRNDVARVVLNKFDPQKYLTIGFNSDIFSVGSGLASSSSYMISLIRAMGTYTNKIMSDFDVCKLALELEREFNPLTGQQDPYGCGMMDFKRMDFTLNERPKFTYLPSDFLDNVDIYLLYTGDSRSSTDVLKSINLSRVEDIVELVGKMEESIINYNYGTFYEILNEGWNAKKSTSPMILSNDNLTKIDQILISSDTVKAHKLCGAGGGGHFVIFTERNARLNNLGSLEKWITKVSLSADGLRAIPI